MHISHLDRNTKWEQLLRSAHSTKDFYAACRTIVKEGPVKTSVTGRAGRSAANGLAMAFKDTKLPKYARVNDDWLLDLPFPSGSTSGLVGTTFQDMYTYHLFASMATFCAFLGGYYWNPKSSKVEKWTYRGSSAGATINWFRARFLPTASALANNLRTNVELARIESCIANVPYPEERFNIVREMVKFWRYPAFTFESFKKQWSLPEGATGFEQVRALGDEFPFAFGLDPFHKKALLAYAQYGCYQLCYPEKEEWFGGMTVAIDLPVPADYQLPRILAYLDLIQVPQEVRELFAQGQPVNPWHAYMISLRAATVVACHDLYLKSDVPTYVIDALLFNSEKYRGNANFEKKAMPIAMPQGMWF